MNKTSIFSAIILLMALSVFSINTAAQTFEENQTDFLLKQLVGDSVVGIWNLNAYESEDPVKKIQTLIQESYAIPGKAEQTQIPGISISILPPERLVLAGDDHRMTVNEYFMNVISTRTIKTNGLTWIYSFGNNTDIAVTAIIEENIFMIETLSPRGNRMVETYELFADGRKLRVLINISNTKSRELLTLERIYDRATVDDYSEYL